MNRIYRLVWNRAQGVVQVASELNGARNSRSGRHAGGIAGPRLRPLVLAFAALLLPATPTWAAAVTGMSTMRPSGAVGTAPRASSVPVSKPAPPSITAATLAATTLPGGGRITAGSGSIGQDANTLTVNQQSQNLSLNWQSFNIGTQATVNFLQPNSSAVAVNRIADSNGSVILGHLNANGQVFLINPNGILFGQGAQVNVGGLVASTLDVGDSALGNRSLAFSGSGTGSVVNQGSITAANGGYVALLGNQVINQGAIHAQLGTVALAGGSAMTLTFNGSQLATLKVDQASLNALAENGRLIQANGGQVLMTASARDSLLASVVNNTGLISANGISTDGGTVQLVAAGGNAVNSGTIDASGVHGGRIELLADRDVRVDGGTLDASGSDGGGAIRVGGGVQGGEGLVVADRTYVADGAVLDADATDRGDGGSIAVFSNGQSVIGGQLLARGGAHGGDGGFVETSSHGGLTVAGTPQVSARAPGGLGGEWLIDPNNITIVGGTGHTNINADDPFVSTGDSASLGVDLITDALTDGAIVTVSTGTGGAQAGNITLNAALDYAGTGTNSLTFEAANDIQINNQIYSSVPGADRLDLTLRAGNDIQLAANLDLGIGSFARLFAGGDISQTGGAITADTLTGGSGGDTGLASNNQIGNVGAFNADNFRLNDVLGLSVNGPLTVTDDSGNIAISAGGTLRLNTALNGGTISLASASGLNLNNDITAQSGLTLSSTAGDVTQTAGSITSAGDTTVQAGAGMINLAAAGNDFQGKVNATATGGDVTLTDSTALEVVLSTGGKGNLTAGNALTVSGSTGGDLTTNAGGATRFGATTIGGNLSATAAGTITQSGALGVTGTSLLDAGTHAITLDDDGNDFGGAVDVAGAGIALRTGGDLVIGTLNAGADSSVSLIAGGALSIPTGAIDTGTADLTLAANGGMLITGGALSGGNIALTGRDGLTLGDDVTASGALYLATTDAAITQSGGRIAVAGTTGMDAGNGAVSLAAANDFGGAVTVTGGDVTLRDVNALTAILTASGNGDITAGDTLTISGSTGGDLTTHAAATSFGATTVGGNLSATASDAITQSDALGVTGTTALDAGTHAITLDDGGNDFGGAVTVTGGDVTLRDVNALTAILAVSGNGDLTAGDTLTISGSTGSNLTTHAVATSFGATTVGGNLSTTASGAITQTDALGVTGTTLLDAGTHAITLSNAGNDFTGGVSATGGGVSLHDANDLAITSLTDNGGAVNLVADGTLALPAGDIDTGSDDLTLVSNGGSLVTPGALGGGNVSLNGRDGVTLNGDVTASGTLRLASSGGSILQVAGIVTAGTLTGSSSGATTLTGANVIGTLGSFTAAGFNLVDTQALTVSGPVDGGSSTTLTTGGDLTINGAVSGTSTTLTSAGAINEGNNGTIVADTLTGSSAGATTLTGANQIDKLDSFTAAGFSFNDTQALVVGSTIDASNGNALITTADGYGLTLATGSAISGANVTLVSGGAFTDDAGINALSATNGTWQVWSQSPANDTLGNLAFDFKQYGASYGTSSVLGSGNGVFYAAAPTVTVKLTGFVDKTYDGTAQASIGPDNYIAEGSLSGDVVTINGLASGTYDTADTGTGKTVTVSGMTLSDVTTINGAGIDVPVYGYTLGNNSASAAIGTIDPATLTIAANNANQTYNGLAWSGGNGVSYSGFVNGETSSVLGGTLAYGGDAQGAINAGDYTLTSSGLSSGNYAITYANGSLRIDPATLTITANDANQTYNGLAWNGGNGVSYSGFVNGETSSVLGGTLAYGGDAQGAINAGDYTLTSSGLSSGNYVITYADGSLRIDPATLTITANDANQTYSGLAWSGGNGVTYSGFVNGETSSVLGGTLAYGGTSQGAINAGDYTLTSSGLSSGNYAITYADGSLRIDPAQLTYVASLLSLYAGQSLLTPSGAVTGFLGDDTLANSTTGELMWSTAANADSPAGGYAITGSGLLADHGNYVFQQDAGNATALTIINGRVPTTVGTAVAGLQHSVGQLAPWAIGLPPGPLLTTALPSSQADALASNAPPAPPARARANDLYAPDLRIVDGGVRLP